MEQEIPDPWTLELSDVPLREGKRERLGEERERGRGGKLERENSNRRSEDRIRRRK